MSADETLAAEEGYAVRRRGRFLIVELLQPHRVLCTSAAGGGQREDLRYLVNHQSCEGRGHQARFLQLRQLGEEGYHRAVCDELGLDPDVVGLMGTAANMNCAAFASEEFTGVKVRAVVTAGVEGNAGRAGDPARWHEGEDGWCEVDPHAGTINVLLLVGWPLTPAALARAAITLTEAKSAALQELAVSSRSSAGLATGTGTDQYAVAAPLDDRRPKANTGHHARLGELIGRAVLRATRESLRWQNGLEPSLTRSIPYALRRFGLDETRLMEALRERLDEEAFSLLEQNQEAVLREPGAVAAAYAFAAVWDRVRYGGLPPDQAAPALRQQAAVLASCLAARPDSWQDCWERLAVDAGDPLVAVADAVALGWRLKWE